MVLVTYERLKAEILPEIYIGRDLSYFATRPSAVYGSQSVRSASPRGALPANHTAPVGGFTRFHWLSSLVKTAKI